jgi:hypothetical protein
MSCLGGLCNCQLRGLPLFHCDLGGLALGDTGVARRDEGFVRPAPFGSFWALGKSLGSLLLNFLRFVGGVEAVRKIWKFQPIITLSRSVGALCTDTAATLTEHRTCAAAAGLWDQPADAAVLTDTHELPGTKRR